MRKEQGRWRSPVGLRTIKTALAVTIALTIVQQYGASPAKVVFATIGAISAVGPTFTASVWACLSQICGVTVGALLALLLMSTPIHPMVAVGVGIILILSVYYYFHLKLVPVLPCLVLVNACLDPAVALAYSTARIWDTAIGLAVGMVVNTLIFPYDNSRSIRRTMEGLDGDLILFLGDLFDGDDHLPDTGGIGRKIGGLEGQLALFADQRLFHRRRQKQELCQLRGCRDIARELLIELEALRSMDRQGHLDQDNRRALEQLGAKVTGGAPPSPQRTEDVVVNYHVARVLALRLELKERLSKGRTV